MRNICRTFAGIVTGIALFALPSVPAEATVMHYSQSWLESGAGLFDDIQQFVFAPQATNIAMTSLDNGWSSVNHGSQWVEASGIGATAENYNLQFDYESTLLPIAIDFYAFLKGAIVDSARITFLGGAGSNVSVQDPLLDPAGSYLADQQASAVPEPMTLALFLFGLVLIGIGFSYKPRMNAALG